jgi:hypothetical protein
MRGLKVCALAVACTALVGGGWAGDPAGLTGTWKWTVHRNGKQFEAVVKLKLEGGKLTGVMIRKAGDLKVEEGCFRDGEVSFTVPGKTPDGRDMVHKYQGKLQGDVIKGKATIETPDVTQTSKWEAKRAKG